MKTTEKKLYASPIVETYKIELQQVIAGSTLDPDDPTVTIGEEVHHGPFSSREFDYDYDDEE